MFRECIISFLEIMRYSFCRLKRGEVAFVVKSVEVEQFFVVKSVEV